MRSTAPSAHAALEDALYQAVWVDGDAVDDADMLDELVSAAGASAVAIRAAVDDGAGAHELAASMADAHAAGVAGTPAWAFGEFVLPGVQPRALYERVVAKLS
jgi:predicted DsbA family dithiol-disulfide isomerase